MNPCIHCKKLTEEKGYKYLDLPCCLTCVKLLKNDVPTEESKIIALHKAVVGFIKCFNWFNNKEK